MYVKVFNIELEIVIVSNKTFQDTDWGIFKNNFRGFFRKLFNITASLYI